MVSVSIVRVGTREIDDSFWPNLGVECESMVETRWKWNHIIFNDLNPNPFIIARIADIKISGTFKNESNFIIRMNVFLEELLQLQQTKSIQNKKAHHLVARQGETLCCLCHYQKVISSRSCQQLNNWNIEQQLATELSFKFATLANEDHMQTRCMILALIGSIQIPFAANRKQLVMS